MLGCEWLARPVTAPLGFTEPWMQPSSRTYLSHALSPSESIPITLVTSSDLHLGGINMLDNNEVRAHIRKGEQAVTLLTSLGYVYKTPANAPHVWEAPVSPVDELKDALEAIIKARVQEAVKADPRGPNWHLVEGLVGKDFMVRPENIPEGHTLRIFNPVHHFRGKSFNATKIEYRRDPNYTGYAVSFNFNVRPFRQESVWIPLSACAFR